MIKKIIFKIGNKDIELTESEAKKLYQDLEVLFGQPTVTIPYVIPSYYPQQYPYRWDDNNTLINDKTTEWCIYV